jgi:hypothetical protein
MPEARECFICGAHRPNSIESHHIVPQRYGGSDAPENLVNLCSSCHSAIEKLYDDSFYDRLGVDDTGETKDNKLDVNGTTAPPHETKDREYPPGAIHVKREDFGLQISFTQFYIHEAKDLISSHFPESDLLVEKLEDVDVQSLKKQDKNIDDYQEMTQTLAALYPENERMTPPVRIVNSDTSPMNKEYASIHQMPHRSGWFSRLHCGYCHTVYTEFEKADLAAHLRVQHQIEDPYENVEEPEVLDFDG